LAQQVVVGVVHQAQPLAGQVQHQDGPQEEEEVEAHRQAHAVHRVQVVMDFF
jgi:glycine cleavage system H lipoate-binding protein